MAAVPMVAPNNSLEQIEVPGLAEALQRESDIRDRAFLPLETKIAGIAVRAFSLNHLLALDALKNGFVVPCVFERPSEQVAHAIQFLGIVSPLCELSDGPFFGLRLWFRKIQIRTFIRRALKKNSKAIFDGIAAYVNDAMYDAPHSSIPRTHRAVTATSFMAAMVDDLYAAGYRFTESEILNMSLARLWQYWRLACKRRDPTLTLPNPSDQLVDAYIAKLNAAQATRAKEPNA